MKDKLKKNISIFIKGWGFSIICYPVDRNIR